MQIRCPNCGNVCETDEEPTVGQHLLCPFCRAKFCYSPNERKHISSMKSLMNGSKCHKPNSCVNGCSTGCLLAFIVFVLCFVGLLLSGRREAEESQKQWRAKVERDGGWEHYQKCPDCHFKNAYFIHKGEDPYRRQFRCFSCGHWMKFKLSIW